MESEVPMMWHRGMWLMAILAFSLSTARALDNAFWPEAGEVWAEQFCLGQEIPLSGDFNGDRRADIAVFTREATPNTAPGAVRVALSDGTRFSAARPWHAQLCAGSELPVVGDFNGDGKADVAVVARDGAAAGTVWVAFSDGERFSDRVKWLDRFCVGTQVPLAGDFNGDGRDDLICFVRSAPYQPGPALLLPAVNAPTAKATPQQNGDVLVALSGKGGFLPPQRWIGNFCLNNETPMAADFNGDGQDDIITFVGGNTGNVWVALSNRQGFDAPAPWGDHLCEGLEVPAVGQFNDDRFADVAAFVRNSRGGAAAGDVFVALTEMLPAPCHFGPRVKRHDWFGIGNEVQVVGDYDGDRKDDLATIVPGGRCYVVHSGFNRPTDWTFSLPRYLLRARDEITGDDPYFVVIGFRSRFNTAGSTQVYWGGDLRETGTNLAAGSQINVPAAMGTVVIPAVTQFTVADGILLRKPEVVGAIVIAMESDGTPFGSIRDLMNRIKDQGVRPALQRVVEQRPLPMTPEAVQQLITDANAASNDLLAAMNLNEWDIIGLFLQSGFDVDDFIDYHIFLYLAADESCQRFLNTNVPLPGGVEFGRLAEKSWRFSNVPAENHPIVFDGRVFDQSGNTRIDANFDIRYTRATAPAP